MIASSNPGAPDHWQKSDRSGRSPLPLVSIVDPGVDGSGGSDQGHGDEDSSRDQRLKKEDRSLNEGENDARYDGDTDRAHQEPDDYSAPVPFE